MSQTPALVPELDVTSLEASLTFYTDILGFTVKYSRPEEAFAYLVLATPNGEAHLMLEEAAGPGRRFHTAPLQAPFGRGLNLQLEVHNAASLHAKAIAANHTIILPLEEKSYRVDDHHVRQQQFVVADPDGYLIRPFSQLKNDKT